MTTALTKRRSDLGVDTIGWLRQQLTGLGGFVTMLYELVQNAEDEGRENSQCDEIEFEFTPDALIVRNRSSFDDDDWDRITRLASGGKALEVNPKIGTFGIGFVSVYQITDCPEVLSAGEHAIFRPERQRTGEGRTVEWRDAPAGLNGTEFRLPWANTRSRLRDWLEQPVISDGDIDHYWNEAIAALPDALLFLHALTTVRLRRGEELIEIRREDNEGRGVGAWRAIIVSRQGREQSRFDWLIAEKQLERPADVPSVRADREASIALAVPQGYDLRTFVGRLFCFLPTQHETGLRFHIHGTFFAKSDRKGIERDGHGDHVRWNKALLYGVAPLLGEIAPGLWGELGFQDFYELIPPPEFESAVFPELNTIKPTLETVAKEHSLVPDRQKRACRGSEVCFPHNGSGAEFSDDELDALELLGASFVHPDVTRYSNWLSKFGVLPLTLPRFRALRDVSAIRDGTALADAPAGLRNAAQCRLLYSALAKLIAPLGTRKPPKDGPEALPLALSAAGSLCPFTDVWTAHGGVFDLFAPLLGSQHFWEPRLAADLPVPVSALSPEFTVANGLDAVEKLGESQILERNAADPRFLPKLYMYFAAQKSWLLRDSLLAGRFRKLPIFFATDGRLKTLDQLSLPGAFGDPLHLGITLDLEVTRRGMEAAECREFHRFLDDLGIDALSLETYCRRHVTAYFDQLNHPPGQPWPAVALQLLDLLRQNLRMYQDRDDVLDALRECACVPTAAGRFQRPGKAYLPSEALDAVFGAGKYMCVAHEMPEARPPSWAEFYTRLGVKTHAKLSDIIAAIKEAARQPASPDRFQRLRALYAHLNGHFDEFPPEERAEIASLASVAWMPVHGNEGELAPPRDLYTPSQRRLFESQARSIAFEEPKKALRELLGLRSEPEPKLVVRHLLHAAENKVSVDREVYRFLSQHADDPALGLLRGKACIDIGGGKYAIGTHVFFDQVPFGRYRHHLAPELQEFRRFFEAVGVRPASQVTATDYSDVLAQVAEDFAPQNLRVDEPSKNVILTVYRWAHAQLDDGQPIAEAFRELRNVKCVLGNNDLLYLPGWVLLGDKSYFAEVFQHSLKDQIIPKDRRTWRALHECLGVRTLSESIRVTVDVREGEAVDDDLTLAIRSRAPFFRRVIETRKRDHPSGWNDGLLERLEAHRVVRLQAVWEIAGAEISPPPIRRSLAAWFDRAFPALIVASGIEQADLDVARELAAAVNDEIDPSFLVPLFERIMALGLPKIGDYLDKAGVDRIQEISPAAIESSQAVSSVGAEQGPLGALAPTTDNSARATELDVTSGGSPRTAGASTPTGFSTDEPPDDSQSVATKPGSSHAPTWAGGSDPATRGPEGPKPDDAKRQGSDRGGGVERRSYIRICLGPTHRVENPSLARARREYEQIAIDEAKRFEEAHDRTAVSRERDHCGYDLQSSGNGDVRYIEVKGLGEEWSGFEVQLTSNEFDAAWQLGTSYYLYVVDRIATGQPRLRVVRNPARSGDYYAFDNPHGNVVLDL